MRVNDHFFSSTVEVHRCSMDSSYGILTEWPGTGARLILVRAKERNICSASRKNNSLLGSLMTIERH